MAVVTPRFLQTKQYSARLLRDVFLDAPLQPGVVGATDLQVTQRGAGANMSVDIAAGAAWVKGTSTARQGLYNVYNDATVNIAVPAANATNPRIDQIVMRIYDSTDGGSSQDIGAIELVVGTPTSSATLNNRTGVGAVPAHSIVIADILVGAAAASITNAVIRDRRPWARGAYTRIVRTTNGGGTSDYALGTSNALVDATNLQPRIECSGNPIKVTVKGLMNINASAAGQGLISTVFVDGSRPADAAEVWRTAPSGISADFPAQDSWTVLPVAGSHLLGLAGRYSAGTSGKFYATATFPLVFEIEEVVRQNVANNAVTTG